jgi:hypothetical protein
MGLRIVQLPGGWHLNARRVPVRPVPPPGQARWDEIQSRRAILTPDLHEDPTFARVSEWWDHPTYEPYSRHRSGLLSDEESDYAAEVYPPQQVPYWVPPPSEVEDSEEVALLVEEYQH